MCGRYSLEFDEDFYKRYRLANKLPAKPNYNVTPSQLMPVVVAHSPNRMEFMLWGLIPFWEEKNEKPRYLANIRDDSIINKRWADKYVQFQRCLVPATSYFEWKKTSDGKVPFLFKLTGRKYFAFAGVYSIYKNPKNRAEVKTYSIITTTPNKIGGEVHNRMPVILKEEDEQKWLNPDMVEIDHIKEFLKSYPDSEMMKYVVSTKVNNPSNNIYKIIKELKGD
ncbi:hypothetical protein A2767_02695 [Candidatus Roizmanbacteria bacterium RIFCSPHIGHO2_01_FULL_35_10]|uniref:Abasic site processing protein n=1 Tax=Candidatus Roizmanbacteria bacterium RIFCSPLOWO2_01_FULL_35_13 TaxID=1802055 RepID=A0A1F7IF24_9BACT|nr:MAG: hypothetical protein A2767_02695 [Candidatus Roizmanbacteria bacterium RIFCSPHIGHO2_01_FULL_35_10]OGK41953.1 MAG: hypothetical protein A3A74_04620 [Candidatus Roizmanbacteria bacterium RIFCSPLOWO2_01_FULL_35_13]